jgi:3-oxoacyl-[acyl-carrier protein] reductase
MIILTGSTGGIGKEIVKYVSEMDCVIGIYNRSFPAPPQNDKLTYEKLNIENPEDIRDFVKKCEQRLSRITLIHCAATKIDGIAANYKKSDWDHVMKVNLSGNFLLTQAVLPYMIRERWGRIIHISSRGGIDGAPGTIAYSTAKTGLIGMSRVLAKEYARYNITSNVLVLGTFKTGMFLKLPGEMRKEILDRIPSKAFGKVANISNAVEFLIKSEYVNASIINIDGGV